MQPVSTIHFIDPCTHPLQTVDEESDSCTSTTEVADDAEPSIFRVIRYKNEVNTSQIPDIKTALETTQEREFQVQLISQTFAIVLAEVITAKAKKGQITHISFCRTSASSIKVLLEKLGPHICKKINFSTLGLTNKADCSYQETLYKMRNEQVENSTRSSTRTKK